MIDFFIYVVLAVCIGALAVWVLGKLAPDHPAIVDNIIWVIVVLVVVIALAGALGLSDVPMPRIR